MQLGRVGADQFPHPHAANVTGRLVLRVCGANDPVALSRRAQDALAEYFYARAGGFSASWQSAHNPSRKSIEYARLGGSRNVSSVVPELKPSRYIFPVTARVRRTRPQPGPANTPRSGSRRPVRKWSNSQDQLSGCIRSRWTRTLSAGRYRSAAPDPTQPSSVRTTNAPRGSPRTSSRPSSGTTPGASGRRRRAPGASMQSGVWKSPPHPAVPSSAARDVLMARPPHQLRRTRPTHLPLPRRRSRGALQTAT